MNSLDLEEILQKARKRTLDEYSGAWLKNVLAKNDFEFHGHQYFAGSEYELSEGEAKELMGTNKIEIVKGGWCDVSSVKRIGKPMLYAYRSWHFGPPTTGPKNPYGGVMLRVRLNQSRQVIVGLHLRPGEEFFMPYSDLGQFEFDLETDPSESFIRTLTVLADQD